MGEHRFPITTRDPLAQRFFDQGLALAWGFNFAEAKRSFREAARLDPECAMCRWGIAYALGPSINHDMSDAAAAAAGMAIREARALERNASDRERALIEALSRRFAPAAAPDRAYAGAMRAVARRFPADAEVLTLLADALMVPHGRDYWRRDGSPRPWTREILALLERALRLAPDHPGANHFYVHVLEDSPHPERALASAKRLATLAPGVGHLMHMPSHVYLRLGDYAAALHANERAIAADRAYLEALSADPAYIAGYVEHNFHFLWYAAIMAGRSEVALSAASELARYAESSLHSGATNGTLQHYLVLPLYTQVRFGRWQEILAAAPFSTPSAAATAYTDGVWHYARGMACVRTQQHDCARDELKQLESSLRIAAVEDAELKNTHPLSKLLGLSHELLRAELAAADGDIASGIAHARAAIRIESGFAADEPPAWHMPARHTLGALLLQAGRAAEAARVYREDLRIHPENGWSLAGLAQSLARQGRPGAAAVRERFERAWKDADVAISGSRF